jgi:hypothetical protein
MIQTVAELELRTFDTLTREQLITLLLERVDCLPRHFTRERLEGYSTEDLQILLLAAKLLDVLRSQDRQRQRAYHRTEVTKRFRTR